MREAFKARFELFTSASLALAMLDIHEESYGINALVAFEVPDIKALAKDRALEGLNEAASARNDAPVLV